MPAKLTLRRGAAAASTLSTAPITRALRELVAETSAQFGLCLLIDCHSMPSVGGPMDGAQPAARRRRLSCSAIASAPSCAERSHRRGGSMRCAERGYRVRRNTPYSGGYRHAALTAGPRKASHALQIEINRALYMDETTLEPTPGFAAVAAMS